MRILFILLCVFLAGCAELKYTVKHYSDIPVVKHETPDGEYRIFDKPHDGRIMITPSMGSSLGRAVVSGLTFNSIGSSGPKSLFQDAALSYFVKTGRDCRILDGYLIMDPQWEFRYECSKEGNI